jgi:hypothetical protein
LAKLAKLKLFPSNTIELGSVTDEAMRSLADQQAAEGDSARALETYRKLLESVSATRPDPQSSLVQALDLSRLYQSLASLERVAGDLSAAQPLAHLAAEDALPFVRPDTGEVSEP